MPASIRHDAGEQPEMQPQNQEQLAPPEREDGHLRTMGVAAHLKPFDPPAHRLHLVKSQLGLSDAAKGGCKMAKEDLELDEILLEGSSLSGDDGDLFQEGEDFVVGEHLGDFESYEDFEDFEGFEGLTRSRPFLD